MATRRNVPANGDANAPENSNGHLPAALQAPSPTTTGSNFAVSNSRPQELSEALDAIEKQYYPGQPKSLSGIARRAFLLGNTLSFGVAATAYLAYHNSIFWRLPAFAALLSVFHFLEFYTTARFNTHNASIGSFLFSANGSAYMVANTSAFIECLITCLLKTYHPFPRLTAFIFPPWTAGLFPSWDAKFGIAVGLLMVIVGQTVRALAMIQAGKSFNHIIARHRAPTHTLVTHGMYAIFRHPSYFGYYYWAIGTQLLIGNTVSFFAFAAVLWIFFSKRIAGEEKLLVNFFGQEYEKYRKSTGVWIPFI